MTFAKIDPVTVARKQKRSPSRAAEAAASSRSMLRVFRKRAECQAARRKASAAIQAMGTWKKTIREDSPTKFSAGWAKRKAPQRTATIPMARAALPRIPRTFIDRDDK